MESDGGNGNSHSTSMMLLSYGDHHHHHHHHTNSMNSMDIMNPNHMPLGSTNTSSFHHLYHHNLSHHHDDSIASLPPLPSPLGGVDGGGSSNINHLMMLDNYYHSKQQQQQQNDNTTATPDNSGGIKAKIMAHPHYPRLLSAYVNCHKVGAPPEVVTRLEDACSAATRRGGEMMNMATVGEDPSLDQFMEAYCEMLCKYQQELTKPFKEAMLFLSRIESQFKSISLSSSSSSADSPMAFEEANDRNGSSDEEEEEEEEEEEIDIDVNASVVDPLAEDRELKCQLLRKYSGYLGSLKQEFMKKRKKGKLPKEARQQLLEWWSRHYKWPYPSESQKLALADATGLGQKQINNWFINQRKRHWKPSEDMQYAVMDATISHHPHYYADNVLGNPYAINVSPALL